MIGMYNPITEKDKKMTSYHEVLDKISSSLFPGMNLKQILFNECLYCQDNKSVWKKLIKNLFFVPMKLDADLKGSNILCLYTKNYRSDHDEYWEKIKEDVGSVDSITLLYKIRQLNLTDIPKKISWFIKSMRELSCIENRKDKLYLAAALVARKWVFEEVKKLRLEPKLVMCYFDSGSDENVLMQYFKQQGAITVANQHGLCIYKSKEYDLMNQSQILNFKSDYFLARSERQREEFVRAGFDGNKIIVVGYIGNKAEKVKVKHTGVLGLLLDTPAMPLAEEASTTLIKYADELSSRMGFEYIVKCHPSDDVERYKNVVSDRCIGVYGKEINVQKALDMVDLSIVHSSSSYVDAYEHGVRCLKYCSEAYFPIAVKEDEFSTCDELAEIIRQWNEKPDKEKEEWITDIRSKYAGKWEDGNIRRAIEGLLASR